MNEKLKPCPFCGGEAKLLSYLGYGDFYRVFGVFCLKDLEQELEHGHCIGIYTSPQEAIDDWNRRVLP